MPDFLFRGELAELDPDVAELIRHETARQARYLILIPSESSVPQAVREALASSFHNIYAEGYPLDATRTQSESEILDYKAQLNEFRRQSDNRYYKGTEYADIVEALARRRVAEMFAQAPYSADDLFVNVQPSLRRARQQCGLQCPAEPGRHRHGHGPDPGRAPHARQPGQPQRHLL